MLKDSVKGSVETALLIWDVEDEPPLGERTVVLWRSYDTAGGDEIISIPQRVEDNADILRARYLAWVYELGETKINDKRIVDHLELRPGFSYWWMMPISQKYNDSDTSQINNVIKLFVFEELISKSQFESVELISNNKKLALTLQTFSKNVGLDFKFSLMKQPEKATSVVRLVYDSLPCVLRGVISVLRVLIKTLLFLSAKQSKTTSNGEISFIDVLVHLDRKAIIRGEFISNYWTALVGKLIQSNIKVNWFHIYFFQEAIPSFTKAQGLLRRFNKSANKTQAHSLIQENLSLKVFFKGLMDYFCLSIASIKLSKINYHFMPAGSALDLWPMFKDEWVDSLRGQSSVFQCLEFSLYEKTFKNLQYQKVGVYIQENQPWEMALIYAWRTAGHGKLIGMPHTTVRFWDLRYFYDIRTFDRSGVNSLPAPDKVAVNGLVAKKAYLTGGYPKSDIVEVEALRFNYLSNHSIQKFTASRSSNKLNVLICGDYLATTTNKILSWMAIAARLLPHDTKYIFKSHPACQIHSIDFPSLTLQISKAPLDELFLNCDVVFTSSITSASVDAYCSGIPVVQMLDGRKFNTSPLRDLSGWGWYVTNPNQLGEAIRKAPFHKCVPSQPYFFLDDALPRWQKLLDISAK